ncbi:MAG: transglycosylase SLT domain-containing protein [Bdellovibrionaceae bacterium]|nr:transglycosylase SLT domain-containing protein [Bdellovibrionales bacterium]MCB9084803.1 transglycosylase SLT domain-containing protein [Pseudobdellovibrionaceae bacterium]
MNYTRPTFVLIWLILISFFLTVSGSLFGRFAAATSDEETPVVLADMDPNVPERGDRPWFSPDYSNQENALGYGAGAFAILPGMEERVSFWIDIYSELTTDQGLLHDSRYVHIVYEKVDFTDIQVQTDLTDVQKVRARRKRVNEAKKVVTERLHRLEKLSSPAGLDGEDLRYWYMFAKVDEKNKFKEASTKGRLRFQLGQKDRFLQGIHYSGRYLRQMERIFREAGLPIELTRIPFVESSFNLKARSRAGASGIWQFMRYTGRQFLKINWSVDERNDPIRATEAAARLLKINYGMLESWPLAVTAYNHGPAGMRRLVQKEQTSNLVDLLDVRKGRFGFASANFYASFLAALEVEKNAKKYFKEPMWMAEHSREMIKLNRNVNHQGLLDIFGGDVEQARYFNPHVHSYVWRGWRVVREGNFIFVPPGEKEKSLARIDTLKDQKPEVMDGEKYRVQRGDTLSDIAQRFGVTVRAIINANEISNPRALRAGQKITIPK